MADVYELTRYPLAKTMLSIALQSFKDCLPMYAELEINGISGSLLIRNDAITQGSLSIDRYCVSGNRIEIGSAIAGELAFTLNNPEGKYDAFVFEGAIVQVKLLIYRSSTTVYQLPMGYFTVDEQPRKLQTIKITALDSMMRFNKVYDSTLVYPATLSVILNDACLRCGVILDTLPGVINTRLNGYTVTSRPAGDNLTYREIIQWVAELAGSCAYISESGKLKLSWFDIVSAAQYSTADKKVFGYITPAERYKSDMYERNTVITGVRIVGNDEDATEYLHGTTDYAFNIEGNLLAQNNLSTLVASLGGRLTGFSYRPYNCTIKGFPHLWPLDSVTYVDKDDTEHYSVVTNHTFKLNGNSEVSAKGQTAAKNGYATANPLTRQQQNIINKLSKQMQTSLTSMQQAQLELNRSIANGMGLYTTTLTEAGVSNTYYHDGPTLAESGYIFTQNSGGFAWTQGGWNGGSPVWSYGFTAEGNAVLHALNVYKLSADIMVAGILQSADGTSYFDLDTGDLYSESATLNGLFTSNGHRTYCAVGDQGWAGSVWGIGIQSNMQGMFFADNSVAVDDLDFSPLSFGNLEGLIGLEDAYWGSGTLASTRYALKSKHPIHITTGEDIQAYSGYGMDFTAVGGDISLYAKDDFDIDILNNISLTASGDISLFGYENITLGTYNGYIYAESAIMIPNGTYLRGKNTAGNYFYDLVGVDTDNRPKFGNEYMNCRVDAYQDIRFFIGGTQVGKINSTGWHGTYSAT